MHAVAAVVLATSLLFSGVHQPAEVNYVALGDSYAAGLGAGDYDLASGACERSARAYSALWAAEHSATYTSVACNGASTADVISGQLSALSDATTLVTITVGGTDIGFSSVLTGCVLGSDAGCAARVRAAESAMTTSLSDALDRTYQAIRQHAPLATLVVVGYPRLFELGPCLFGLSLAKRTVLNEGADMLAGVIADRAKVAGALFADARPAFAGHGVCSGHPWIHGVTIPLESSYHPTATGQSAGYLPLLDSVAR